MSHVFAIKDNCARQPCRVNDHRVPKRDFGQTVDLNRSDHIVFREANHSATRQNLDLPLRNLGRDAQLASGRGIVLLQYL